MKVTQSGLTVCDPMNCSLPGSSVLGILQTRILEWVAMPSSRGSNPNPGIKPMSPALQVDTLLSEPPEKPKNTGEGRLSLLQGIFLTQESNWGLLHCRQILYPLSYQGSSIYTLLYIKQITNKDLLYSTGKSTQYSVMAYMGKEYKKSMDIWICITDLLYCIFENNTTL